jgi:hypothetical protein
MQEPFKPLVKFTGSRGNIGSSDTDVFNEFEVSQIFSPVFDIGQVAVKGILAENSNDKRLRLRSGSDIIFDTGSNLNGLSGSFVLSVSGKGDGIIRIEFILLSPSDPVNHQYVQNGSSRNGISTVRLNGEANDDIRIVEALSWRLSTSATETVFIR